MYGDVDECRGSILKNYKTEQEEFWAGQFGDSYIDRNANAQMLASSINMFSKIIGKTAGIESVLEFGPNIGMNLSALEKLIPNVELSGVEINGKAVEILKQHSGLNVYHESFLEFVVDYQRDFVFTRGVLIHINPDELDLVYSKLYETSKKYICVAEYYNPAPVSLDYRGEKDRLFKRDFAGELMKKYSDLKLVDYGFIYKNDENFAQDDITWFLMEKCRGV